MAMPGFYVSPEQLVQDKADFARKGIARGRALVGMRYVDGIVLVAENTSATLRKISEIYDRIAFGGVGRYNEFDSLRIAGVRHADQKGFVYSREDVDARSLANQYAQIMGQIFTHEAKPLEVEILVAEIGADADEDQLFHIMFDGTVIDETDVVALGGDSGAILERLQSGWAADQSLSVAVALGSTSLAGPDRMLTSADLEVAVLRRGSKRRTFERLSDADVTGLLGQS